MFKIVAPVKSLKILKLFYKLGIDDFYGGLNNELSGRNTSIANFPTLNEFKESVAFAKKNKLVLALTLNTRPVKYTEEELYNYFNEVKLTGIKNIIISDYLYAKTFKDNILHISSLSPVYNKLSILSWLKLGNTNRIIFPRELSTIEKINMIKEFPNLQFEIFLKNDWCYISCDTCSGIHFSKTEARLCMEELTLKLDNLILNNNIKQFQKSRIICKACELYSFKDIYKNRSNDLYLKIVGRQKEENDIVRDVLFTKLVINNIKKNNNYTSFIKANIDSYNKIYGKKCYYKKCAYYLKYAHK